jgi:DNA-binding beta-propeller fold protein YncE
LKLVKSGSTGTELLNKITVVLSLLFLVAMVSMSSIASNVYAAEPQFNGPRGVAVDSSGNVYVTDTGNDRVQKFSNSGTFIRSWGSFCDTFGGNECNGKFDFPQGIALDSIDRVYVVDTSNDRIQKFGNTGTFIRKWGSSGDGNGQFSEPSHVAVDTRSGQQTVFVSDFDNHNIQKFTNTGSFIKKWGSDGSGNGQFRHPEGVAVDKSGNVFVVDENNHRIQKFTNTGGFIRKWGSHGTGNGQFDFPRGIAVDKSGNVFVSDPCNDRIQKFSNTGTFITKWGTLGSMPLSSMSESLLNPSGAEQLNPSGAEQLNPSQNTKSIDTQDETASEFP